jgi:hypothetical protein
MSSIAYAKHLHNHLHERRFLISVAAEGWEVVEEADREVVRQVSYSDWHRVERARRTWLQRVDALKAQGWVER